MLSDWVAGAHGADAASLRMALLVLAPTGFWATWHFMAAARTVAADQRRAIGSLPIVSAPGNGASTTHQRGCCESHSTRTASSLPASPRTRTRTAVKMINADAHFPEGPIWYQGKLYYVEYDRNSVTVWDGKKNTLFWSKKGCGPSAVIPTARGEFLTTCYDNGIDRTDRGRRQGPSPLHPRQGRQPVRRAERLRARPHGGIYFTGSGTAPGPVIDGKIFYLAADGTITQMAVNVHNANGIAVSNDGKILYVIETDDHRLIQFKIAPGRLLFGPPRLCGSRRTDESRRAHLSRRRQNRFQRARSTSARIPATSMRRWPAPSSSSTRHGKLLRTLKLPSPGVPNFAFSPDEKTLYVTALDQLDKSPTKASSIRYRPTRGRRLTPPAILRRRRDSRR